MKTFVVVQTCQKGGRYFVADETWIWRRFGEYEDIFLSLMNGGTALDGRSLHGGEEREWVKRDERGRERNKRELQSVDTNLELTSKQIREKKGSINVLCLQWDLFMSYRYSEVRLRLTSNQFIQDRSFHYRLSIRSFSSFQVQIFSVHRPLI